METQYIKPLSVPIKCVNCGRTLRTGKCSDCGVITLTEEQVKFINTEIDDMVKTASKIVRYRVQPGEERSVILDCSIYRQSIEKLNLTLSIDSLWEHTSGEIWKIIDLSENVVRLGVVNTKGVIITDTIRILKRHLFVKLIRNNYYGRTTITHKLQGSDINSANIRENFV